MVYSGIPTTSHAIPTTSQGIPTTYRGMHGYTVQFNRAHPAVGPAHPDWSGVGSYIGHPQPSQYGQRESGIQHAQRAIHHARASRAVHRDHPAQGDIASHPPRPVHTAQGNVSIQHAQADIASRAAHLGPHGQWGHPVHSAHRDIAIQNVQGVHPIQHNTGYFYNAQPVQPTQGDFAMHQSQWFQPIHQPQWPQPIHQTQWPQSIQQARWVPAIQPPISNIQHPVSLLSFCLVISLFNF